MYMHLHGMYYHCPSLPPYLAIYLCNAAAHILSKSGFYYADYIYTDGDWPGSHEWSWLQLNENH